MCGIVGFTGKEKAVPYLINCLEGLEYRGYDSSGIALSGKGKIEVTKRKGKLSVLRQELFSKRLKDSACGIGHTRWATHGAPEERNAHPHLSKSGLFAVVHNGIIENYLTLKNELINDGFQFASETDTEVIAHLLEKNYCGDFLAAVRTTLPLLEGSYALAILCRDFPGRILCCRQGSPLVLAETDKGNFISSDVTSIIGFTKEIYRLDNGECALIDADRLEFFTRDMKPVEKQAEKIQWNTEDADKKGYSHFMLKEIFEQGETADKTLKANIKNGEISFDGFRISKEELEKIQRIAFIGCGSAYHAGLSAVYVTQRLTGIYCSAEIASEWRYDASPVSDDCLCVFISQSGETADTIAALKKAKSGGARVISVVNVPSCTLSDESDTVIYTKAGPEIAVATTKAYTAQLFTLYLLAIKIARLRGKLDTDGQKHLTDGLCRIRDNLEGMLITLPGYISTLSKKYAASGQIYFIGRGTDYAAAMEGALKLKEVSYIPCEAYAAGELKHGTISLIEKGTPVVALAGNNELFTKTLSNIKEVKSRGAKILGICSREDLEKSEDVFTDFITVPRCEGCFSAIYEGIVLQLFAYYIAAERNCDIDKPRNLAKSVTVE